MAFPDCELSVRDKSPRVIYGEQFAFEKAPPTFEQRSSNTLTKLQMDSNSSIAFKPMKINMLRTGQSAKKTICRKTIKPSAIDKSLQDGHLID